VWAKRQPLLSQAGVAKLVTLVCFPHQDGKLGLTEEADPT